MQTWPVSQNHHVFATNSAVDLHRLPNLGCLLKRNWPSDYLNGCWSGNVLASWSISGEIRFEIYWVWMHAFRCNPFLRKCGPTRDWLTPGSSPGGRLAHPLCATRYDWRRRSGSSPYGYRSWFAVVYFGFGSWVMSPFWCVVTYLFLNESPLRGGNTMRRYPHRKNRH